MDDPLALVASERLSLLVSRPDVQQDSLSASSPSYHRIFPHAHLQVVWRSNDSLPLKLETAKPPLPSPALFRC